MLTKKTSVRLGFGTFACTILNIIALGFLVLGLPNFFPNEQMGGRVGTDLLWALFVLNLAAGIGAAVFLVKIVTAPQADSKAKEMRDILANCSDPQDALGLLRQIHERRQEQVTREEFMSTMRSQSLPQPR